MKQPNLRLRVMRYMLVQSLAWVCLIGVPGLVDVGAAPPTDANTQAISTKKQTADTYVLQAHWKETADLRHARTNHAAVLLPNGKVLVIGGITPESQGGPFLASAELFDPTANGGRGGWSEAGGLHEGRAEHTATLLPNGKVLVVGGRTLGKEVIGTQSCELFDPTANRGKGEWLTTAPLKKSRYGHTTTLLPDGKVIIVGGFDDSGPVREVELYDSLAHNGYGVSQLVAEMNAPFGSHASVSLPNGMILIVGAEGYEGTCVHQAELFTAAANQGKGAWTVVSEYLDLCLPTATPLLNGKVVMSGVSVFDLEKKAELTREVPSAWLFDPMVKTANFKKAWTQISPAKIARQHHTATLLKNGQVLLVGGQEFMTKNGDDRYPRVISRAEIYNPEGNDAWSPTASMKAARVHHTATLLADGRVLVVGGHSGDPVGVVILASAELYDPTGK